MSKLILFLGPEFLYIADTKTKDIMIMKFLPNTV